MLLRGSAHSPFDNRGFEWVPIVGGVFFLLLGILTRNRNQESKRASDLIPFILGCGAMIALGIWSLVRR